MRLALTILPTLLAGYAIAEAVRFARAEQLAREDTVEALQGALRLTPGNADYYARIATLDPSRDDQLRVALALNPTDPSRWIMLSVRQEEEGDAAGAEQSLRRANQVCRYFTPRWSLAAFYYRHGNQAGFIQWARLALASGSGQTESLFQMAQRLGLPSSRILQELVPDLPASLDAYLHLVLRQGKVEDAYAAAAQLMRIGSRESSNSILETSESLFAAGKIDPAVDLWNTAIRLRWVAGSPLDPASGRSLANGSFAGEPLERGFDWKTSLPSGVSASLSAPDRSLSLVFSGRQPENCELMSQFVPLLPGRHYQIKVRYRLPSLGSASGLQWSVLPLPSGKPLMMGMLEGSGGEFVEHSFAFETAHEQGPLRIALAYNRLPGTVRLEGEFRIQSVQLTLLP